MASSEGFPDRVKAEPEDNLDRETIEFLQTPQPSIPIRIYARPEIRKGCSWDIQLKFSSEFIKQHNLQQIYLEKPRGGRNLPFLCLKVRSKLIKPVRELALTKVATILNEVESFEFNEFSAITLKVKFTARPRAVFHKHSDMMIFLVAIKKGEQTLCNSEFELIFRGGTGSMHSADSRKALATTREGTPQQQQQQNFQPQLQPQYPPPLQIQPIIQPPPTQPPHAMFQSSPHQQQQMFLQQQQQQNHNHQHQQSIHHHQPLLDFQLDDFTSVKGSEDFLNGLWELSNESSAASQSNIIGTNNPQKNLIQYQQQQQPQQTQPNTNIIDLSTPDVEFTYSDTDFSVVHGKRRGMCVDCMSECQYYRGTEGQCLECGCFPSAHLDLDRDVQHNKKRLATEACEGHPAKRARFLLKYYQKRAEILAKTNDDVKSVNSS